VSFASLPQPFTGADARAAGITARMLSGLTGAGLIRRVLLSSPHLASSVVVYGPASLP
jgi:hypothetical protein